MKRIDRKATKSPRSNSNSDFARKPAPSLFSIITVYTLCYCLLFQPVLLFAAGVPGVSVDSSAAASQQASLNQAANGVGIVNIAKPSAAGVSHNKYTDLNISRQGLIFNNSQEITDTQLAGFIDGNAHLGQGSANIILNEVTSTNRSLLNGYSEIAGQSAEFVIANPNGISCDGCGFINTPRATLTTGTPTMSNGVLNGFSIDGGDIALGNLNADNLDRLDIFTRALSLNGDLYANRLNIITGRNNIDYNSLATSTKDDDGSVAPEFALDASALGGMYGNRIKLIGTEAGIGVNVAGEMAASIGNIELTVDGDINIVGQAQAAETIALDSPAAISVFKEITAKNVELTADAVELSANVIADQSISLDSDTLNNTAILQAESLTAEIGTALSNSGALNIGQTLILDGHDAELGNSGTITADTIRIDAADLINSGTLTSQTALDINATDQLNNRQGTIQSNASRMRLSAGTELDNSQGAITHGGSGELTLIAETLTNRQGSLVSDSSLAIDATTLDNRQGSIDSSERLDLSGAGFDNSSGVITSTTLDISGDSLTNNGGLIEADQVAITTSGDLINGSNGGDGGKGTITSLGSADNSLDLNIKGSLINDNGLIQTNADNIAISAKQLTNDQGTIVHAGSGELTLEVNEALNNNNGELLGNGAVRASPLSTTRVALSPPANRSNLALVRRLITTRV
jgi:filamentous hemagglutinin